MTTKNDWQHIGAAGTHASHYLRADDMQDVHFLECGVVLSDDDAAETRPAPSWLVYMQAFAKNADRRGRRGVRRGGR